MIKGTVNRITKNGKAYNIEVDGEYYGFGFDRPSFEEGTMVQFEVRMNGKWKNVDKDSFEVLGKGKPQVERVNVAKGAGKDDYWNRKEERDIKNDMDRAVGASRNTAITFVQLLLSQEALTLPAKKQDKADALLQLVDYYAGYFMANVPEGQTSETSAPVKTVRPKKDAPVPEPTEEMEDEDYE